MDPQDVTAIATALTATVSDLEEIIPPASSVEAQVEAVGPTLLGEMQRSLQARYGTLPAPLTEPLRTLLTYGVLAELLFLGYRRLEDDEKAWPDEWRRRFEQGLAALASGVDEIDDPASQASGGVAMASDRRIFTLREFGRVL